MASACSYQVPLSLLQLLKLNSLSGRSKKRGGGRRKKSALLRMLEAHPRIRETIPRRIRKNTKISKRLVNTVFSTFGLPRFHNAAQCCDNFIQIRLQDSRFFFLKISKEIGRAWRMCLTHAKLTSLTRPDLLFDCSRVLEYAKIRTVLQSTSKLSVYTKTSVACGVSKSQWHFYF